jgi:hypothetical protein
MQICGGPLSLDNVLTCNMGLHISKEMLTQNIYISTENVPDLAVHHVASL